MVNELFLFEEKDKHGISAARLTGLAVVLKYCKCSGGWERGNEKGREKIRERENKSRKE